MEFTWISLCMISLLFVLQLLRLILSNVTKKRLPPGPIGLPIIGSLHLLGKFPHRDLQRLSQKYGPIMCLKLGVIPTIVVSSPEGAELFLRTHDVVFATRPPYQAAKLMSYGQKGLGLAPYNSYWRNVRKLSTLELLSTKKINSFRSMRKEELDLMIDGIRQASRDCLAVDVTALIGTLGTNMSCRMIFGRVFQDSEFSDKGFKAVIQEGLRLAATPNIGDFIPLIAGLDLQGLNKKMKATAKICDDFLEKIVDEHMQYKNDETRTKDFVDVMLGFMGSEESEYRIDREHIKAIILDMLTASLDTSATAADWALSELLRNPKVLKKLQEELETKVGLNKMVEESDLEGLEYLNMVIKETFRLYPVAPLLLPHASDQESIVNGFLIPKGCRVMVNTWAIGRDPKVWNEPERFYPERFEGSSIDVHGRDFQLLPFGAGRRKCPGLQLGYLVVRLVLAQLVHCFDWELPDSMEPSELDMTEVFGLVTSRSKHLFAIPTYRLLE